MPVRSDIAERYEAMDTKPGDLTWEGIDAFAAEMKKLYGPRSLEYAHALALNGRKARWTRTESRKGKESMEEALDIVREDLRGTNQVWWRYLLCLLCHQENQGLLAIQYADETSERAVRAGQAAEHLRSYKGIATCMLAWRDPVSEVLEALRPQWAALTESQRSTQMGLLQDIATYRKGLSDEDRALLRSVTGEANGVAAAIGSLTPTADLVALKSALAELDRLTGLAGVKKQVHRLVAQLRVRDARREAGLPVPEVVNHMAFLGPPGTGKTTVARLLGRIFKALGILATDKLVETDRSGLVAQYVGQTAPRVNAKVDEALGGVLFIDEAYALAPTSGNDFGHEAISTLLKRMEDDRQRLVVVLAGYSDEMQTLLGSNPGLRSRVPTIIDFRSYTSSELQAILKGMFTTQQFALSLAASARAAALGGLLRAGTDERTFGNAREVRNIVDDTIGAQALRLEVRLDSGERLTRDDLRRIEVEDVTWAELGDPALDTLGPEHAEVVAVHEAGHALVRQVSGASPPVLVTIVPSGHALGRTFFSDSDRPVVQRGDLIAIAAAALGGRAAEEEVFGAPSAGAIGDLAMAERILLGALRAGLSEEASDQALSEYVLSGAGSSDGRSMSAQARQEVAEMLAESWAIARAAVRDHRRALDAVTDALIAQRTVSGRALERLLPPAPVRAVSGRLRR